MSLTFEWRGKPVWIVNRTKEMLDQLNASVTSWPIRLRLPIPSRTMQKIPPARRKEHENFLVVEGVCTHLGCSPTFRKDIAPADLGADWKGGFYCPCHGSKFDLAARVFKGSPGAVKLNGAALSLPERYAPDNRRR